MITITDLTQTCPANEYYEHGQILLSEEHDYATQFTDWIANNEIPLKKIYLELVNKNVEEILDSSFLEWAMISYIICDYNRIQNEINTMINPENL